ncbi:hypothetical protein ABPG74_008271 [Tetrahymena malaccensis]
MQVSVKKHQNSSESKGKEFAPKENTKKELTQEKEEIRVPESIFLGIMHVLAIAGLVLLFTYDKQTIIRSLCLMGFLHYLSCLGIGSGVHRLWAHRSYKANTPYRVLLMVLQSLAFQGSIFHWSRDHRLHHKFSDTDLDPHTMNRGFFFAHMGWLLVKKSKALVDEGYKIDVQDLLNDPVVMFQKKNYYKLSTLICFIIPTFLSYFIVGGSLVFGFLTAGVLRYIFMLHITWCVNSVCHMFGTRPYNPDILPTENLFVSIFACGEGWHNWHHEYPRDWRACENKWYKWNPNGWFIQTAELFGFANTHLEKAQ